MKRTIEKHFLFSREEAQELQKKSKKACVSEAALIRFLLKGYEPKEKPDERFYDVMRELSAIGNNIHQLSAKANALNFIDAPMIAKEAQRWHKFQADVEREVVRAHLGFCDKCHTTQGEKNRRQTFYEIAIDHEYSSAEAVENIYKKALEKMKKTLRNLI